MTTTVFCGTSVDGFIARHDDTFDFLPADGGEPHGFEEFIATVDAIVMGRNTYNVVRTMGEWPYADRHVIVLSHRDMDLSGVPVTVERMSGTPAEILAKLTARGFNHLYIDGGITIQEFLRAGLINRFIITRVPVLIGQGISLFGALPHDVKLRHVATRSYATGLVQSEYEVVN